MLQASRIAVFGLWALLQLFAPLVHAHAGGSAPFSGAPHVPGLEFLAKPGEHCAQPFEQKTGMDVIVGLAPGFATQNDHAANASSTTGLPSREFIGLAASCRPLENLSAPPAALPVRPAWLQPTPRAPPSLA